MKINMVDLVGQYQGIKEEVDRRIHEVLDTGYFIGGPEVKKFGENLEKYLNVKHVIPCGNGTDALQLGLMALDLKPGDEVITTPFTFVATAEVIKLLGLKAVFVDIEPDGFNIDPKEIEKAITANTKCIIPVHLFGMSCNMDEIMDLANQHGLFVIEDNAQAIGSYYNYKSESIKTGTIGHIGTTSFFPSKNLGCYGDGGAVMTNDDELAQRIKLFANHGSKKRYYYDSIGINSRLDAMQAVVLDTKLKYLDQYISKRQEAAAIYNELLSNHEEIICPPILPNRNHVFHQYTLRILNGNRDKIVNGLKERGIPFGVYYPLSLHKQPAYMEHDKSLPVSEKACEEVISLPMHTELSREQQVYIVEAVLESIKPVLSV